MIVRPPVRSFLAKGRNTLDHIPRSRCISPRSFSAAAAEVVETDNISGSLDAAEPAVKTKIMSGLILCRGPIITPELTPFEKAYYQYQSELTKRLMWTFPHWFYFPEGTLAGRRYELAQKKVDAKDREEFEKPDILFNRDRRTKQTVELPPREVERETEESMKLFAKIEPLSRTTQADAHNDVRSLERKLDRTLYLLVRKNDNWTFPIDEVTGTESLTEAAKRLLQSSGGPNMHTWFVSNSPVAHQNNVRIKSADKIEDAKVFYLRSRIFAGAFVPQENSGITDYAWLAKEEIKDYIKGSYYNSIEGALNSR